MEIPILVGLTTSCVCQTLEILELNVVSKHDRWIIIT